MSITVGIDVSKDSLDLFDGQNSVKIVNDKKSIKEAFKSFEKGTQVVLESTGKYHRLAHEVLSKMGYPVMVINPYQSRYFAKALNIRCKTDRVDARVLWQYGKSVPFEETVYRGEKALKEQELMRHLSDLEKQRLQLKARQANSLKEVYSSLQRCIKVIEQEIERIKAKLSKLIKEDDELREKQKLLCSIPGIGAKTAVLLLCLLRELGELSKNEISALVGVAPMNNDSGTSSGQRVIKGGRHDVRCGLYMPAMGAATQHNPRLKEIYERLVAKGKPKKVAITACMRKLVVWANAILATEKEWDKNHI